MDRGKHPTARTHESVDHLPPTDAGLMNPEGTQVPATGVFGDETLVRIVGDGVAPYPGAPPEPDDHQRGGEAHPAPTHWPRSN